MLLIQADTHRYNYSMKRQILGLLKQQKFFLDILCIDLRKKKLSPCVCVCACVCMHCVCIHVYTWCEYYFFLPKQTSFRGCSVKMRKFKSFMLHPFHKTRGITFYTIIAMLLDLASKHGRPTSHSLA